ncbi:MAG: Gfo/Idh/MocA family protein [Oscillospiraceae bacterium]
MKNKFNVAIIGAGIIARQMSETLVGMENAVPYAIASRDPDKAKAYQAEYGFKKAFGSYEEMLSDPDIDLVYIATPHSHHAQHAMMCLEAGKPVLSEKAFAANAKQAKEVLAMSREKNIYVGEAIWPRYMPMRKTICDFIGSGRLGKPISLMANLGYNVFGNGPRLREPSLAGGALLDVGVYALTFASILFGDDVKNISASAIMADNGVDASDSIYLEYCDGKTATLFDSIIAFTDRKGLIHMEDGCAVIENINNFESLTAWKVEGKTRRIIEYIERPKQITGFEYEVQSAFDAIAAGRTESPEMPHSEIIRIMEQMDDIRSKIGLIYPFE